MMMEVTAHAININPKAPKKPNEAKSKASLFFCLDWVEKRPLKQKYSKTILIGTDNNQLAAKNNTKTKSYSFGKTNSGKDVFNEYIIS